MFEMVSVLIPTRGRPARLRTLLDSFARTASGCSELFFRVDDDDAQTQEVLVGESYVVGPRLEGYKSLPTFFNELAAVARGDVLMLGNDDMVFRTPGWDRLILDEANLYPDGVFDLGVSTHNNQNFPFATVSRKAVEAMGFISDPRFFWSDIFLRDVMSRLGRAIPLPEVEIEHDWVGHDPDRVFAAGERTRRASHEDHHEQAVAEAVERLSVLL